MMNRRSIGTHLTTYEMMVVHPAATTGATTKASMPTPMVLATNVMSLPPTLWIATHLCNCTLSPTNTVSKWIRESACYSSVVFCFMVKSKPKTIEEILRKFEPDQTAIAERLRTIVKATLPKASETVRRGVITYVLDGKDFAMVRLFKDHVDLGLASGAKIDDKKLKGRGKGKDLRHIKIASSKTLNEAEITRLLKEAAAIA
jgi:hypothetical protein